MRRYILIALAFLAGASLNTADAAKKDKKERKTLRLSKP